MALELSLLELSLPSEVLEVGLSVATANLNSTLTIFSDTEVKCHLQSKLKSPDMPIKTSSVPIQDAATKQTSPRFRDLKIMFENFTRNESTKERGTKFQKRDFLVQTNSRKIEGDLKKEKEKIQGAKLNPSPNHPQLDQFEHPVKIESNPRISPTLKQVQRPSTLSNRKCSNLSSAGAANFRKRPVKPPPKLPHNYLFKPISSHFKPVRTTNPTENESKKARQPPQS